MTQEPDEVLAEATAHHVAGRLPEAGQGYRRVLALAPEHAVALHRLGVLTLQEGDAAGAEALFARAVAQDPAAWRSHASRGQALAALGEPARALDAFRAALAFNPGLAQAHTGSGDALMALGRRAEAIDAYQQALALEPALPEAWNNVGIALQELGRPGEAVAAFRRAVALREDFPLAHANLGNALLLDRQTLPALEVLQGAASRWPEVADLQYNLGIAAFARQDFQRAAQAFRRAVELEPGHVAARNNLGNTYQALGRYRAALDVYRAAIPLRPDFVDTYNNASAAARTLGLLDEAMDHLRRALALKPDFQAGHCNLGNLLKDLGRVDEAMACYRRALELDPADAVTRSNLVYTACFHPDYDAAAILRETLGWDRVHGEPLRAAWRPHANDRDPGRQLRIGYVSPNFKEHVLAHFLAPLLAHHDPEGFRTVGYSLAPRPDAYTLRFKGLLHEWRDVADLDDAQLAERIRADGIDILVDLTMHMANGRPLMFARKPAPVQVAWLAYPGTTGLAAMDCRLTDPNLDPPGSDGAYSERSVRLEDVFSCYDPLAREPRPGPLPALANGFVTFGAFNSFSKLHPGVEALWCRVLEAVPGSRLLLLAQPGDGRERLLERMAARGAAGRIDFTGFLPRPDYLALHKRVDLCLDTFPYSGHTTSLDALWMGVPVVTKVGRTVVGRTCWTLLCNLGLTDLAAHSEDDYVRIASALAADLPRLEGLRAGLRDRMEASPLMDAPRFARALEKAYRAMWVQWCSEDRHGVGSSNYK